MDQELKDMLATLFAAIFSGGILFVIGLALSVPIVVCYIVGGYTAGRMLTME